MSELKPCPFCGGKAELVCVPAPYGEQGMSPSRWFVHCPHYCCKQYPQVSDHDAVEQWNARMNAPPMPIPKTLLVEYKGYTAKIIEDDDEDQPRWHGMVLGINDLLAFDGDTQDEAVQSFHDIIDDYLETCEKIGKKPDSGSSNRMDSRPLYEYLDSLPKPKGVKDKLLVAFSNFLDTCEDICDLLKNYDDSGHNANS